jgi:lysozyme family protein
MTDFDKAFENVIGVEGSYVNDKNDPGGETYYGISQRAYPEENIADMTMERAKFLYKRDYWDKVHGDQLPSGLNHLVFDCAVNQGVTNAIKLLQKSLGVAQDGICGKDTLSAAQKRYSKELCAIFMADRALRYMGTAQADHFLRGWLKRLFVVMKETP